MSPWRIHHRKDTVSTNLDAHSGAPGDVFTADYQTAGRGRLDHKWLSPPGTNLMMSVVLSVEGLSPEHVSTLPLVAGLAVARGLSPLTGGLSPKLKWPNDVLVDGRKLAGILCERQGDNVIVGVGVNVGQRDFPPEIAALATSLALLGEGTVPSTLWPSMPCGDSSSLFVLGLVPSMGVVRDRILAELGELHAIWRENGFAAVYPQIVAVDALRGQFLSVLQTDDDTTPISGICGGILPDGSLDVGGVPVYAGEAHVTWQPKSRLTRPL